MSIRITQFFETNGLFSNYQFGFRSGKSTVMGILNTLSSIIEAFHNKQYSTVLFCDLSKAFDCVDHGILLRKLASYNLGYHSIKLLKSYLDSRCQIVKYGGKSSEEGDLNIGVPQGSILGPILFLIYINDLPMINTGAGITIFADDTTLSFTDNTLEGSLNGSMIAQAEAEQWFSANRLLLNKEKSKKIVFSLRAVNNCNDCVTETGFLGVTLDANLQWEPHINEVAKKLARGLYAIRSLSNCVSLVLLKTAYYSIFHSHISYAILAWGHSSGASRLFAVQRKAVRLLAKLGYRDDCREAFVSLKILTLPSLYILECLMFAKRNITLQSHEEIHDHNTRKKKNLVPLYRRLKRCQDGPGYWAIKFFNVLPQALKELPVNTFQRRLKYILLVNAFYNFDEFLNHTY